MLPSHHLDLSAHTGVVPLPQRASSLWLPAWTSASATGHGEDITEGWWLSTLPALTFPGGVQSKGTAG